MKRFGLAVTLACVLSGSAFAGDIHSVGASAPGEISTTGEPVPGEVPMTEPRQMPMVDALMALLNLTF